jgi:DNA-binding PadR family transcriptional regulator
VVEERRVPIKHAVLGLLVERRGYGFELSGRLDERLGAGLAVPSGTVYTSLSTLEREGFIKVAKKVVRGRQIRVYYEPTPEGVAHFERWMDEPLGREPLRGDLYLRFALLDEERVPALREAFELLELECVAEIAEHSRSRRLTGEPADPVPLTTAARWLLDSSVLDHLNADLQFISRTLAVLRRAESEGTIPRTALLETLALPSAASG